MQKTILITGSTDGIGLETARMLISGGHHILLHGRNPAKLEKAKKELSELPGGGGLERTLSLIGLPCLERTLSLIGLPGVLWKEHCPL